MPNRKTKRERFQREGPVMDHPALLLDLGCKAAPACLACPLAVCRYDAQHTEIDRRQAA